LSTRRDPLRTYVRATASDVFVVVVADNVVDGDFELPPQPAILPPGASIALLQRHLRGHDHREYAESWFADALSGPPPSTGGCQACRSIAWNRRWVISRSD
jgi:hypothetical protein